MPEREFSLGGDILQRLCDAGLVDRMVTRVVIDIKLDEYPVMYIQTTPSDALLDEVLQEPDLKVVRAEGGLTDP
jgi:hypothetical protein